jgi:hypothetical protein
MLIDSISKCHDAFVCDLKCSYELAELKHHFAEHFCLPETGYPFREIGWSPDNTD